MKTRNKIILMVLIILSECVLTACNSPNLNAGYVVDKFFGEASLFRYGSVTILNPTQAQTGYVLVIQNGDKKCEICVDCETYKKANIGDYYES